MDHNIPESYNNSETDFKEHYHHAKRLEHKLRNEIAQKDSAITELAINCETEKQANSKLMD